MDFHEKSLLMWFANNPLSLGLQSQTSQKVIDFPPPEAGEWISSVLSLDIMFGSRYRLVLLCTHLPNCSFSHREYETNEKDQQNPLFQQNYQIKWSQQNLMIQYRIKWQKGISAFTLLSDNFNNCMYSTALCIFQSFHCSFHFHLKRTYLTLLFRYS